MAYEEKGSNEKKGLSKGTTILIIIGVVICVIALFVLFSASGSIHGNAISPICHDVQVAYNDTEYTTVSEPYTDNVCDDVNMVYKESYTINKKDCIQQECESYNQDCSEWNWLHTACNKYVQGSCASYKCVKYKIGCGMKIENQEKEPLTYSLSLNSYNFDTKQTSVIKIQDVYVSPLDTQEYLWDFTALPTDNLGCVYEHNSMPTMKNCHDVIKNHDVQKTLIVTKYRTEQQCN